MRGAILTELVKLMKAKAAAGSDIPAAAERFAARLDEKPPTLTFSDGDMSLAGSLFGRGKIAPPSLFDELTKEYLFLPQSQNVILTKSVLLEKMFPKLKKDKNFSYIFRYVEQMAEVAKHLRISERPVFLAMGGLTRFMNAVRLSGKDLGFLYPEKGLLIQLLGPWKIRDQLTKSRIVRC